MVGEKLGDAAMRVLRERGIDVRLGLTLREAHSNHIVLADDSRIDTHTVAWVTGVTGAPFIEKLGLPTERGRLKVRTDLQVPGHPDVFAAGDAAAVPDLGPHYAVANPLNIHLSGYAAKFVTRMYHLYAIPRFVNRWAVSLSYLTDVFFGRSVGAGRDWIAARWWFVTTPNVKVRRKSSQIFATAAHSAPQGI